MEVETNGNKDKVCYFKNQITDERKFCIKISIQSMSFWDNCIKSMIYLWFKILHDGLGFLSM